MKVDKGRTLEEFIDYLQNDEDTPVSQLFSKTVIWNNFCKQKPVKGMFGHRLKYPSQQDNCYKGNRGLNYSLWQKDHQAWQAAEDKVIFKEFELSDFNLEFFIDGNLNYRYGEYLIELKTLAELFRFTNGELELKNLEI